MPPRNNNLALLVGWIKALAGVSDDETTDMSKRDIYYSSEASF